METVHNALSVVSSAQITHRNINQSRMVSIEAALNRFADVFSWTTDEWSGKLINYSFWSVL